MKNILLATDLGVHSDRALERAVRLSKENGAKLYIVHVAPPYPFPKRVKGALSLKRQVEETIRSYLDGYADAKRLDVAITVIQGGDAFSEILEQARKVKADLIVMGMHGKARFRDLFVGTTVERVIRKGIKPVLMVRNKPTAPYGSVVAGVDFAPGSRTALRTAMDIAPKASFRVIHTYDIPVYYSETAYVYVESKAIMEETQKRSLDAFLKTEIAHFKKEHKGAESKLVGRLMQGPVYDVLVRQIKAAKADLVVLGAHGQAGIGLSRLGGIPENMLAGPACDVLVARG